MTVQLKPFAADIILVGAGLANGLLTLFLKAHRPSLKILMLEADSHISTGRTWCFHHSDVTADQLHVLHPMIAHSWPRYEVRFPHSAPRVVSSAYYATQPEKLERRLKEILNDDLFFNAKVSQIAADSVTLEDGRRFTAPCIVDGRGCNRTFGPSGYQKFVGLHVELEHAHTLDAPILMDATVDQIDGYRFIYVLPWSEKELLIEDTRYSGNTSLPVEEYLKLIYSYAQTHGWKIARVRSQESGVLPLPLNPLETADFPDAVPKLGMAGGFFHPVTGYSLPDAVRLADACAGLKVLSTSNILALLQDYRRHQAKDWQYLCVLNRMMFRAAEPTKRYQIFERFYTLNPNLVNRFYRGKLLFRDKVRILTGKPPVPLLAAMRSLRRQTL